MASSSQTISVAEHLRQAKALLEKRWVQRHMYVPPACDIDAKDVGDTSEPGYCILGAIDAVRSRYDFSSSNVVKVVKDALPRSYQRSIPVFNDVPTRSHKRILSLMDEAIARAKAEEHPS